MIRVNFYELNTLANNELLFAVIMTKFNGQWVYVRHKDRDTWEIPGGHREDNENINDTASRELFEETGATEFNLTPVCIYSVESNDHKVYNESFGQLFYSEVKVLDKLPNFEIIDVKLFDDIPDNLTYPLIQPILHKKVVEFLDDI